MRANDEAIVAPVKALIITLDTREMVLILFEAMLGVKRPKGSTIEANLATIEERDPELFLDLRRMAIAALDYVAAQVEASVPGVMQ